MTTHSPKQHIDHIVRMLDEPSHEESAFSASWWRSAKNYLINPASVTPPRILTLSELRPIREANDQLITNAQPEIDELYKVVRQANYVVLLCDRHGVAIDHRGSETEAGRFSYWGTWLGGVWSEDIEGTNGIGTAIAEQRPVTVHHTQHYRARHINLSCSAAPIFGSNGKLLGILDISCIDPEQSEHSHALAGALTSTAARAVEERLFRDHFRQDWIIAIYAPNDVNTTMLLAVDRDQLIVGADRSARHLFQLCDFMLETGTSLWAIFDDNGISLPTSVEDTPVSLLRVGEELCWQALITPPAPRWLNSQNDGLHVRPRFRILGCLQNTGPETITEPIRGGLPPALSRRVRDYVENHIGENIDLDALATTVGLSRCHFARAFKQSEGMTPHAYLLNRRLEKTKELLLNSTLSLAEIALAAGFADQSHFARRFRQWTGVTPSEFRRRII